MPAGLDSEALKPGPRRRGITVTCTCVVWTVFVAFALWGGYFGGKVAYVGYRSARDPHRALYQDPSLPYRPEDVVRPLIDTNQTFDIVATVWLRKESETQGELTTAPSDLVRDDGFGLFESAIYTETVFHGLRLKDKNIKTSLKLRVPTKIFKRKELDSYDLRGSFVLVPNSPSPLDRVSGYSTWIPDSIEYPPSRSWPDGHVRSLQEEVVDAYGTFTPLMAFHNVTSKCASSSNPTLNVSANAEDFDGSPVLQSHPYIITKSFLRVVDTTKIYNREAYDTAHKKLKLTSCGIDLSSTAQQDWRACNRSFPSHGNQEVSIQLTKESDGGAEVPEWAYAPYLSVSEGNAGPLDLVKVPVNREECPDEDMATSHSIADKEFVDVTWNVVFIGRTPEKLRLADFVLMSNLTFNMSDTEYQQHMYQSAVETANSLVGHSFTETYHPRRAAALSLVGTLFDLAQGILNFFYWYSRMSTVGISITGTALVAGGYLLDFIVQAVEFFHYIPYSQIFSKLIFWVAFQAVFQITPVLMLKTVTHAEFYWWKSWIPAVHFSQASHSERASQRLESQISRLFQISIFLTLGCLFYFLDSQHYYFIHPIGPSPPTDTGLPAAIAKLQDFITDPARTLGYILQIMMNSKSRKFGGAFRVCPQLVLVSRLFRLASSLPWIVGNPTTSFGVAALPLIEISLVAALAYQARKYPSVSRADEEEDEGAR
ncbi:hypothetical protein GALMADRAFT_232295 [Galerina marginata CBS 339.88]|uniref:Uncharacterized protein n=1 Tax=Galerina marginata (strain CBS 339.88) TaxID=685588 RepID=A0A067S7Q1_GALM3|nr:hypothetical protein GALMADRAFT_232295 [Galerina marginata CBS 339.88]